MARQGGDLTTTRLLDSQHTMKSIPRQPMRFDALDLYHAFLSEKGLRLKDADSQAAFLSQIRNELLAAEQSATIVHGTRTEAMFAYVATALGGCVLLKKEDAGIVYAEEDVVPPDYRIVAKDGTEYFVEVKNFRERRRGDPYVLKRKYVAKLERYTSAFGKALKIAVYWSDWHLWTLVDLVRFQTKGAWYCLPLSRAMKFNEMGGLGDALIGVTPPLTLRLIADPERTSEVGADDSFVFTIGGVEIATGGTIISDEKERNFVLYLMMFGGWPTEQRVQLDRNRPLSVLFTSAPPERSNEGRFDTITFLSKMISTHYNAITAPAGEVVSIAPSAAPSAFRVDLPNARATSDLPLQIFYLTPAD